MTSKDFILRLRDDLRTWSATHGGTAEIAGDVVDLFALLQSKPGSVRVVVWIPREDKRGEHEEAGVVDRSIQVFVSRGRSFTADPRDHLVRQTAGAGEPLYDLVEQVRDRVRSLDLPAETTETTLDYKGYQPFGLPTERPVDAYQLEFSIGIQLPAAGHYLAIDDDPNPLVIDDEGTLLAA